MPDSKTPLSPQTENLIEQYLHACANLYSLIPLKKVLQIFRKHNPEITITDEQFIAFTEQMNFSKRVYCIFGQEEIYEDATPSAPLDREVLTDYLYVVDDFESYDVLKILQSGKTYYVPSKEELLPYASDDYADKNESYTALYNFLRDELKLQDAEDAAYGLYMSLADPVDPPIDPVGELEFASMNFFGGFSSVEQGERYVELFADMYNNRRRPMHRGFTPAEMGETTNPPILPFLPEDDETPFFQAPKKPERNEPCPCGSGKKFKKCCIGKGIYD